MGSWLALVVLMLVIATVPALVFAVAVKLRIRRDRRSPGDDGGRRSDDGW